MKKFLMVFVIVIILSTLSLNVFAYELTSEQDEALQTIINGLDDSYSHYVCYISSDRSRINIIRGNSQFKLFDNTWFTTTPDLKWISYYVDPVTYKSASTFSNYEFSNGYAHISSADDMFYSNEDVMLGNTGTVFFSPPIPPPYQLQIQPQPLTQSVTQNLGILLPFGLGILSLMVLLAYLPRFLRRW